MRSRLLLHLKMFLGGDEIGGKKGGKKNFWGWGPFPIDNALFLFFMLLPLFRGSKYNINIRFYIYTIDRDGDFHILGHFFDLFVFYF